MVNVVEPYMDVENSNTYIDHLFSQDQQICLEAVTHLKNSVIGSNKQKGAVIQMGILPRLFQILLDKSSNSDLLAETAITLGSLARGTELHIQELVRAGIVDIIVEGLITSHPKYVEACLRCLRTILSRDTSSNEVLYRKASLVSHLVHLAKQPSPSVQECVMTIFSSGCQMSEHQDILCENGVLDLIAPLLCSSIYKVQLPTLRCLSQMCYQNEKVSELAIACTYDDKQMPDILVLLMSRDKTNEMQLASAKCMTYMFRAGALNADDPRILYKALATLVRMCQKDASPEERVDGAETLAYLTEVDTELQRIASISDHLIATLSELLKYQAPTSFQNGNDSMSGASLVDEALQEVRMAQEMKQAAFRAFSSLAANDEEIRKKIIDTDSLMENIVSAFSDPSRRVRLAAVRCLHSLSRSVQQLRTTFQDHAVWRPLMKLLRNADDDVLVVASSTLCNLLLEFSPSKEWFSTQPILECGAVELLCTLTRRDDPSLRLNGVWALMNMAFQADHKIKAQILTTLGSEHVFRLLSDSDVDVLMKTLGLLRNLLSTKPHIDNIMGLHGKQVMQAIVLILEGDHNAEVKEQAICILANIADGDYAKNFIMSNEDVLKKLTTYMMHSNVKLQIAATFCISNLVWKEEEGSLERQVKLKDLGVQQLLQQLLSTSDTTLFDRVKTALHQFPSQGT